MPRDKDRRDGVTSRDVGVFGCNGCGVINKSPPPPLAKENGVFEGDWGVAIGLIVGGGVVAFTVNDSSPSDNDKYEANNEGDTRQFPCERRRIDRDAVFPEEGDASFLGVVEAVSKWIRTQHTAVAATIAVESLERSRTESPLITSTRYASCSVKKTRWSF
jgi:hypothetical protein